MQTVGHLRPLLAGAARATTAPRTAIAAVALGPLQCRLICPPACGDPLTLHPSHLTVLLTADLPPSWEIIKTPLVQLVLQDLLGFAGPLSI